MLGRVLRLVVLSALAAGGCSAPPKNQAAISAYYRYDFTGAREALRAGADRNDEQVVLNNIRLGLAAMADGDAVEAERAFDRSFELLSTAGLNADRTTAAILFNEDVRIWKGEPFEQALAYYWIAAFYATLGEWDNARAAAANGLFRLTDFGGDQSPRSLARNAARDPAYLDRAYTAVDTNFALGFLMEAIGAELSGASGADAQLDAALEINPRLAPVVSRLRSGEYDTLLLVDYGKGPTKIAYGPDEALVRFVPQERARGRLVVTFDGAEISRAAAACNVDQMAIDHRWNNLEDIRKAKSAIGNTLLYGGAVTAAASGDNEYVALAGVAMMLAGMLTKMGARGDTRYMEFAPQSIYVVPLELGGAGDLRVAIDGDPGSSMVLPDFEPGRPGSPRAVYLRLHGLDGPDPSWLAATHMAYGNDLHGPAADDLPWILGGHDVTTPGRDALESYQAGGHLEDMTVADLRDLYAAEGISFGPGASDGGRHILEGGRALYTPQPWSMGFKRLLYQQHAPYRPRSEQVRSAAQGQRPDDEPAGLAQRPSTETPR